VVSQTGARTLEQSMEAGWTVLAGLPKSELSRLSDAQIAAHLAPAAPHAGAHGERV
jgi:V/A-type H+-transporting ATPase subunit B